MAARARPRAISLGSIDIVELTQQQADFLDWWVTPNKEKVPRTLHAWAEEHGLTTESLRRWRKTEWWEVSLRRRLAELNVSPDRVQAVIDALFNAATDPEAKDRVTAARVLLEYTQQLMPVKPVAPADRDADALSDEELQQLLEHEEQKARDRALGDRLAQEATSQTKEP